MIQIKIGNKDRLCFLVKDGEVNRIVIPIDNLGPIDYQRISKLEAKGGELMRAMRDETLDNGINALVQYQHLLVTVPKPNAVLKSAERVTEEVPVLQAGEKRKVGRPSNKEKAAKKDSE
jgi:hypothetical protein